jgi:hypothetical protein
LALVRTSRHASLAALCPPSKATLCALILDRKLERAADIAGPRQGDKRVVEVGAAGAIVRDAEQPMSSLHTGSRYLG